MKKVCYFLLLNFCIWNGGQAQIFQENFETVSPEYGANVTSSGICPSISFEAGYPVRKVDCLANWKASKGTPSILNENGNSSLTLWAQNFQGTNNRVLAEEVYLDGYRLEPHTNYRLVYFIKADFNVPNGYASFNVKLSNWNKPYYYKNSGDCGTVLEEGGVRGNLESYTIPSTGISDWEMRTVYFSTENESEYFLSFFPLVWLYNNPAKQLTVQLDNVALYKEGVCESNTVSIQNKTITAKTVYPIIKAKRINVGRAVLASSVVPFGDVVVKPNAVLNLYGTYTIDLEDGCIVEEGAVFDAFVDDSCYRSLGSYRMGADDEVSEEEIISDSTVGTSVEIGVYPNPSNGQFTIKSSANIDEIEIYNTLGQEVNRIQDLNNTTVVEVNLFNKMKGMYFLRIRLGDEWIDKKIIIE